MREWRYSSTILDLGTRWEWSASSPVPFTPGETALGTHWIEGWVGPRAVWMMWRIERNFLLLLGIEPRPFSS
jgi:hypothetical protein